MSLKTIIDGSLLADCERHGSVRFGMFRVAEEITKRLVEDSALELYIANTRQTMEEDALLRSYVSKIHLGRNSILSYPFAGSRILKLQKIGAKVNQFIYPGTIPGMGKYDLFHSFYFPFSKSIEKAEDKKMHNIAGYYSFTHERV